MSRELDEAERNAYEMIRFLQDECRKQCEPYVKILANIHSLRPHVYIVDGQTIVPIRPSDSANEGQ